MLERHITALTSLALAACMTSTSDRPAADPQLDWERSGGRIHSVTVDPFDPEQAPLDEWLAAAASEGAPALGTIEANDLAAISHDVETTAIGALSFEATTRIGRLVTKEAR